MCLQVNRQRGRNHLRPGTVVTITTVEDNTSFVHILFSQGDASVTMYSKERKVEMGRFYLLGCFVGKQLYMPDTLQIC